MDIISLDVLEKTTKRQWAIVITLISIIGALFAYEYQRQSHAVNAPKIINIAGKQRMLSQRVSYLQHLVVTDANLAQKSNWQAEMRLLLDEFAQSHEILAGREPLFGDYLVPLPQDIQLYYTDGQNSLDTNVKTFLAVNRDIASTSNSATLSYYTPEQGSALLGQLDTAVTLYERHNRALVKDLRMIKTLTWIAIISLIVYVYRIVMTPLKQSLADKINAQQQVNDALVATKHALEYQIEQRSAYINKIAHDLRSPVSAIISVLDLLPNSRGETTTLLRQGELACERLLKYTDDLTDIIKTTAETGEQRLFNLISLLDDSLAKTANSCELKGLVLNVKIAQALPNDVVGYPVVLRKCLENVLENAVRYTQDGYIDLTISIEEQDADFVLNIIISDTGVGIPKHNLEVIFERFKRLPDNVDIPQHVAGIGLAITRECIEEIGGSVSVCSNTGHGSAFTLRFPLSKAAAHELPVETTTEEQDIRFAIIDDFEISRLHLQQLVRKAGYHCDGYSSSTNFFEYKQKIGEYTALIIDYYMPGLNGEELVLTLNAMLGEKMPPVIMVSCSPDIANIVANSRIKAWQVFTKPLMENRFVDALQQLTNTQGAMEVASSANILLVEDEKVNADMMAHMLTNMGYAAKVASDGQTALSLAKAFTFDCILLDIHLPDMNGINVIQKLKEYNARVPIIVISGDTAETTEQLAIEAGVRYYLFKPVPFQELKNTLALTLTRPVTDKHVV